MTETDNNILLEKAYAAYERLGVSPEIMHALRSGTDDAFDRLLDAAQSSIAETPSRVMPSSFDARDAKLCAYPIAASWRWTSCESALIHAAVRSVMMRLPLFWQLEPLLHAACRAAGAAIFINEPENLPVAGVAIRTANIDAVVTTGPDAYALSSFLSGERVAFPRLWVIVHAAHEQEWGTPGTLEGPGISVLREIHLFPGVPVLEQCTKLMEEKHPLFHLSDIYAWELDDARVRITTMGDAPLPLARFELPFRLREAGTCACGKPLFEKSV